MLRVAGRNGHFACRWSPADGRLLESVELPAARVRFCDRPSQRRAGGLCAGRQDLGGRSAVPFAGWRR